MGKKDKGDTPDEYEKLKDEIIFDRVNEIFRSQPDNCIAAMKELGFEYYEEDDDEEIEEKKAKPENIAFGRPGSKSHRHHSIWNGVRRIPGSKSDQG
jgi:hypothetical protein